MTRRKMVVEVLKKIIELAQMVKSSELLRMILSVRMRLLRRHDIDILFLLTTPYQYRHFIFKSVKSIELFWTIVTLV